MSTPHDGMYDIGDMQHPDQHPDKTDLERCEDRLHELDQENQRLRDEVERLRSALEEIVENVGIGRRADNPAWPALTGYVCGRARRALAHTKKLPVTDDFTTDR